MEKKTHILVVDDEQYVTKLVERTLEDAGFAVTVATDGNSALAMLAEKEPDLVLLDIRMPDMSGWAVLIALKTNRKLEKVPVVIMTASPPTQEDEEIRALRADGLLNKPFSVEELLKQVKTALGEK